MSLSCSSPARGVLSPHSGGQLINGAAKGTDQGPGTVGSFLEAFGVTIVTHKLPLHRACLLLAQALSLISSILVVFLIKD